MLKCVNELLYYASLLIWSVFCLYMSPQNTFFGAGAIFVIFVSGILGLVFMALNTETIMREQED